MIRLLALVVIALAASGCAISFTAALGKDARAAIAERACAPPVEGLRITRTEKREGHIGPDDVTTTDVTEPAQADPPPPAVEAHGSDVSEGIVGVFRGIGAFFRALVPW